MSEFRFALPIAFVLLAVPIIALIPYVRRVRPPRRAAMVYSDIRLLSTLPVTWRVKMRHVPEVMRWLAWVLLVFALARPQSGEGVEVLRGQGIDIVLVIDISGSMAALDFEPQNRLAAAKAVISEFIQGREFDRIGLVVFARNAYHQAPLTLNYPILLQLLDDIRLIPDVTSLSGEQLDGTALGLGVASAANMLRESNAPSKVIVLLTDGDNNAGLDPITAAEAVSTFDIRIYTIGMGTEGPVNIPDRENNLIQIDNLNEDVLRSIAEIGNGLYFRAEDTAGLQQIYQQIDRLERTDVERRVFVRWQDQAVWIMMPALLLLLLEQLLRRTVLQTLP
jgi:Ca-activated chloride channel homolog